MVSKTTIGSSRNLILVSASLFAINYYKFESSDWEIFGKTIQVGQFDQIAFLVIIFLFMTHVVHWWSDYIAYTKWFKRNEVEKNSIFSLGTFDNTESPIEGLKVRLGQLADSNINANDRILEIGANDEVPSKSIGDRNVAQDLNTLRETVQQNSEAFASISINVDELISSLNNVGPNFSKIKWTSRFVVFGWYLIVPACAFSAAILSSIFM